MNEVLKSYTFEEKAELNWKRRTFSLKRMQFVNTLEENDNVRLVEYTNPLTMQRVHWLWKGSLAAQVDRDLGRYLALSENGVNVLFYDKHRSRLSVPEYVPLPRLFARALALCSGTAPRRITANYSKFGFPAKFPVNVYSEVPREIVDVLGRKLAQVPIISELSVD
jgi:hypothetical protein